MFPEQRGVVGSTTWLSGRHLRFTDKVSDGVCGLCGVVQQLNGNIVKVHSYDWLGGVNTETDCNIVMQYADHSKQVEDGQIVS